MDFGEFIAAFGNGYRFLLDDETKQVFGKELFCRELLCSVSKDELIVKYIDGIEDKKHQRDKSAFQAYYRNTNRRSLHPIAAPIVNSQQLDVIKFHQFLDNYTLHYSKEQLLINFQEYISGTTAETLFDDISESFVKILTEEASKPDHRRKKPISRKTDDLVTAYYDDEKDDGFETTYKKKMTLSEILPDIRSKIWVEINEIINACKVFQSETESLNHSMGLLYEASDEDDQEKITSRMTMFKKQREEVETSFNEILKKWFHLYKTYAHIIEIKELTQTEFANEVILPPDNKITHMAGSNTDAAIEKLRQLSEDYLFI